MRKIGPAVVFSLSAWILVTYGGSVPAIAAEGPAGVTLPRFDNPAAGYQNRSR